MAKPVPSSPRSPRRRARTHPVAALKASSYSSSRLQSTKCSRCSGRYAISHPTRYTGEAPVVFGEPPLRQPTVDRRQSTLAGGLQTRRFTQDTNPTKNLTKKAILARPHRPCLGAPKGPPQKVNLHGERMSSTIHALYTRAGSSPKEVSCLPNPLAEPCLPPEPPL